MKSIPKNVDEMSDSNLSENPSEENELVPEYSEVDQSSLEYLMYRVWLVSGPEDGWDLEYDEKDFEFPDGVIVSAFMEDTDEAWVFLENFDEMTLFRNSEIDGVSFTDDDAITALLEESGNMSMFTYAYDFSSVQGGASENGDQKVTVRFVQFGEGWDVGYDVSISSKFDREWLKQWANNVLEEEIIVSPI